MTLFFDDPDFDGQFQRPVGKTGFGMANTGEWLAIAQRVTEGDGDS